MNHVPVKQRLIAEARNLFAENGFDGTSVRAIVTAAQANLGAITYHFGSKRALYEAVVESAAAPLADAVAAAGADTSPPLRRIERIVRTFFAYLHDHPELPRLIVQALATQSDLPEAAHRVLARNHSTISAVIAEGQADGSIRQGEPRLMALSIASQPVMMALMRNVLSRTIAIDQANPHTRTHLADSVVAFILAGLEGGAS